MDQLFYQAIVIDVNDPKMIGRIRAQKFAGVTDNINAVKGSLNPLPAEDKDIAWSDNDPFIFLPLIPYYINTLPKKDELVLIMYMNPPQKFLNQFYINSLFYSPTSSNFQFNVGADASLGVGQQFKSAIVLRNTDGSFVNPKTEGVFPLPGDNALLGRGSADVIVKEDTVLIRAGKFKDQTLNPNIAPIGNTKSGLFQLSRFNKQKVQLPKKKIFEESQDVVLVKYLIEYTILNPENNFNLFTGSVTLYQLLPDKTTNSVNLKVGSVVKDTLKRLVYIDNFAALSKDKTIELINNFIKRCNSSQTSLDGFVLFTSPNEDDKFPIYYRPSELTYDQKEKSSDPSTREHISYIYDRIKLYSDLNGGYGLIYAKDKVGDNTKLIQKTYETSEFVNVEGTYAALKSDMLFLLSHSTSKKSDDPINFDGTLYQIDPDKFTNEILPRTSSMVRGEELIELMQLIVNFLATHTHAYPGLPPTPITQDETQINTILTQLQNAKNTILNNKIRLN